LYWSIHPTLGPEGKLIIGMVWEKSLLNQVEVGDQIISVGEKSLEKFDFCDLLLNPILGSKTQAEMKVRRKSGEVVTVKIQKKKY
ncbi:MAG: hypothetical protein SFU91_04890, partial [Chloroherpetonaceae bacterium]|nr:hypothetical protein [Chloroherpetonaceae bacterium]